MLRPSLYEHLAGFESGLVVVSAAPGFGKSTLIAEWLASQHRPFAWYSLDRYDGDVGLFAEYLGRAVGMLTGRESGLLSLPGQQTPDPRLVTATLVDDLRWAPRGAVIVLDDYHEIEGRDVHEALGYLIEHLPDGVVIAVVSRADPPLSLARLRSAGRLREIRGDALRFTADQVRDFFRLQAGAELSDEQVALVVDRSEGWVSALQLAALGADGGEPMKIAETLTAGHTYIAGYLVDEVLDRLAPELAGFLLETSPLTRFDAELCREVVGVTDADRLLADALRRNAFLIPLEGGWYRYHHLFAELLGSRLARSEPGRPADVWNAAAAACERRGLAGDGVDYALKAGNLELAAAIVERNMDAAIGRGEVARLRSWLRRFPVPSGPAAHVLAVGWAWCRIFEGNLAGAGELLDRIEATHLGDFEHDPRGQVEVMRAMVALQGGDAAAAVGHAERGIRRLAGDAAHVRCLGHLYVGRALHAQGRRDEARPHLERAAGLADQGNTLAAVSALFWLGVTHMDDGNLRVAERSMLRAVEVAQAADGDDGRDPAGGVADLGMAYVRLNQLELADAIRHGERSTRLLERSTFVEMVFRAFFVWAEALSVAGRFDESRSVSEEAIGWLHGRSIGGGPLETWLVMAQARNAWRAGRMDDAARALARVRQRGLGSPNEDESLGFYEAADAAAFALRRGDLAASTKLVNALPDPHGNAMFVLKRQVLIAALHELAGETRDAVAALEAALDRAADGWRYQFSHVGPVIRPVLARMVGRSAHDAFVRSVLERLPAEADAAPAPLVDPLTQRELDVLSEIAAGFTNDEIADRLFISRGTVKRHAANIFEKLGAHHRAEAAAKGRELGLIA